MASTSTENETPLLAELVEQADPPVTATCPADPQEGVAVEPTAVPRRPLGSRLRSGLRRGGRAIRRANRACGRAASLVLLLALLTAVPAFQLISFGYMLEASGRLARGRSLAESLPWFRQAGRLALALLMLVLFSLPVHLLTHWAQVAQAIDPHSGDVGLMRGGAVFAAVLATGHLSWAWIRGGRLRNYLWPAPLQFLREIWRPRTWIDAKQRLWQLWVSLEIPRLFWLGLRCTLATLVYILPPAVLIMTVVREGKGGGAGLVGFLAVAMMGVVLLYIPLLQARFAAENRIRAMFEWRAARGSFRHAPLVLTLGIALTYLLAVPLYLLKIEATPQETLWLPCLFFVVLMLPARIAMGLAMRRARRVALPHGFWAGCARWGGRLMLPGVVAFYLAVLYLSQYIYWDGLQTWVEQHAILAPVPFQAT